MISYNLFLNTSSTIGMLLPLFIERVINEINEEAKKQLGNFLKGLGGKNEGE